MPQDSDKDSTAENGVPWPLGLQAPCPERIVKLLLGGRLTSASSVAKISFSISGLAVLAALIWCRGKHDFHKSGHDKLMLRRHIGNQQKSGIITQRGDKYIPLLGVIRLALENIWIFQRYQTV